MKTHHLVFLSKEKLHDYYCIFHTMCWSVTLYLFKNYEESFKIAKYPNIWYVWNSKQWFQKNFLKNNILYTGKKWISTNKHIIYNLYDLTCIHYYVYFFSLFFLIEKFPVSTVLVHMVFQTGRISPLWSGVTKTLVHVNPFEAFMPFKGQLKKIRALIDSL